jgi:hypothetical protein
MSRSLVLLFLLGGCSPSGSGNGTVRGRVVNSLGSPETGAQVTAGMVSAQTDASGAYSLSVPAGQVTVLVELDWFEAAEKSATVAAEQETVLDVQLVPRAPKLLPEDRALAEKHAQTFDWRRDKLSITVISSPSRNGLERAIYLRNPALYEDLSGQPKLSPSTPPSLEPQPTAFSFPLPKDAPSAGAEAFDISTIKDRLEETPLTTQEIGAAFAWEPAVLQFLTAWNLDKASDLYYATQAVQKQTWGQTTGPAPQAIVEGYLHAGQEIWVQMAFKDFLDVGAGIADDDGDGYKEVFARVNPKLVTAEIVDQLESYVTAKLQPADLRPAVREILDNLYTRTNPIVVRSIGQPYEVAALGTIAYPLAVIEHQGAGGVINVLLMSP